MRRILNLIILTPALGVSACEWFERNYCSDEPVCYKYECEDGYDGSCKDWEKHCKDNPDDSSCQSSESSPA